MSVFEIAAQEAMRQGIDPDLVMRLVRQESGGRTNAVSSKGARGPMQLMPATARDLGVNIDDPADNIRGGVTYLKRQLDAFGGDPKLALAAYNAGPGAVRKYGGVPPYAETQGYVRSIMGGGDQKQPQSGADIFGMGAPAPGAKGGSGADIFADAAPKAAPKPIPQKAPQATIQGMRALAYGPNGPDVGKDVRKAGVSGMFDTVAQMAATANPLPDAMAKTIQQAAGWADVLGTLAHGKMPSLSQVPKWTLGSPLAAGLSRAAGLDYQPKTAAGEWAKTAGKMAPAAILPGSIPQRAANVLLPTIGTEGAGQIARKMGAGLKTEQAARIAGGVLGSVAATTRVAPVEGALPKTEAKAMKYVSGLVPGEKLPQLASAPDAFTGAEAIGQPGKAALGALSRRAGTTGDNLNAEVAARQEGRPGRLLDAFATVSGVHPDAAAGNLQSLVDAGRAKAAPLYAEAYAAGAIDSPKLQALAQRPSVKAAMAKAVKIAAEDGKDPRALGFEVSPASGDIPEMVSVRTPTAETWDYVKRGLDDVIGDYRDPTSGRLHLDTLGRKTVATLEELRNELKGANPAYGKALAVSGDYLSAESAFKTAGQDMFNGKLTERQLAQKFSTMSESEQAAYRGGVANRFYDLAQNGRLDPKVLRTPRVQAKLRTVLGDDAARQLTALGSQEGDMLAFERRYAPGAGSVTQEMKAAMDAQDGVGAGAQIATDFVGNLHRGPVKAAGSAIGRQMQSMADVLGSTRGLSEASRNVAGEKLMLSPAELAKAIQDYRVAPKGVRVTMQPDPRLMALINGRDR